MPKEPSFENALAFAGELISIPGLPGEEREVASRLKAEMEVLGLSDVHIDNTGNVIGVAVGAGDAPPAMLNSPLDVVADGDHSERDVPTLSVEV
ncbi:MAG: hypothetical protein VYD37_02020, partial [Gemmatimonadota bacterium]|nr:hypothetical protein [Gemmatimonadota bacterium]